MLSSKPTGKARVRAFVMVPAMALALIGLATPCGVSSNQRGICRYAGGGSALQN